MTKSFIYFMSRLYKVCFSELARQLSSYWFGKREKLLSPFLTFCEFVLFTYFDENSKSLGNLNSLLVYISQLQLRGAIEPSPLEVHSGITRQDGASW